MPRQASQPPPAKRPRMSSNSAKNASQGATSRYQIIDKAIGEGAYGFVYKAKDTSVNPPLTVAVKRMRSDDENDGISPTALREIVLLKELKHKNLVHLLDVFYANHKYNLVLEWVEKDLRKYLDDSKKFGGLQLSTVRDILYQIVVGLDFCHAHAVFHRDLKPQNILINNQGVIKIADFGLARAFAIPMRPYTHEVVTLWYRAPEILLGAKRYSIPIDMWSVGCIFAELVDLKPLWPGDSEIDQLFRIFRTLGTPNEHVWPGVTQLPDYNTAFPVWPALPKHRILAKYSEIDRKGMLLLIKMLMYNPVKRITARAALKDEFFKNVSLEE